MMNWYLGVLQRYAVFDGRARRREYWMFVLINALTAAVLRVLEVVLGLTPRTGPSVLTWLLRPSTLAGLYYLAVLVPTVAVTVRRLHDTGRSGRWLLIGLIPAIGEIALLVFLLQDSDPDTNPYGPSPKYGGLAGAGVFAR